MVPSKSQSWPVPQPKGTFTVDLDIFWLEGPLGASSHRRQRSGLLARRRGASSRVKGDMGIRVCSKPTLKEGTLSKNLGQGQVLVGVLRGIIYRRFFFKTTHSISGQFPGGTKGTLKSGPSSDFDPSFSCLETFWLPLVCQHKRNP